MANTDLRRHRVMSAVSALLILSGCSGGGTSTTCSTASATCEGTSLTFCDLPTHTLRTVACKGPLGCTGNKCDSSTHSVGDGCYGSASQCDALIGAKLLSCVSGQLRLFRTCSGPRQCFSENGQTGCDVTVGDSCPAVYEARYFCDSVDIQKVARCTDGGVVFYSTCPGAKNCASADGGLICQ